MKKVLIFSTAAISILALAGILIVVVNLSNQNNSSNNSNTNTQTNQDSETNENNNANSSDVEFYTKDELRDMKKNSCNYLTLDDVMQYADDNVQEKDLTISKIAACMYSWNRTDRAAINAKNAEITNQHTGDSASLASKLLSSKNNIGLTLSTIEDKQNISEKVNLIYRSIVNQLTDTEKEEIKSNTSLVGNQISSTMIEKNAYAIFEETNELETKAAWSENQYKLVFIHKNIVLALEVNLEGDVNNKEIAIEIAQNILNKLK